MNKRKKIVIFILIFVIIFSIIVILYINNKNKYEKIGRKYYDIAVASYLGDEFSYEQDANGNYKKYIFTDEEEFYKVSNINDVLKNFSNNNQANFLTDINVIKDNNEYYVPIYSYNYLSEYISYKIKYISKSKNKIKFKVVSTFCIENNPENINCREDNYINKINDFVIIKKDNKYYIDSFIFPKKD